MASIDNDFRSPLDRIPGRGFLQKRIAKIKKSRFKKRWIHELSPEERFTWIYRNNYWSNAESVSGPGSTLHQTEIIRRELPRLVAEFQVQRLLDLPCGDFNWMRHALEDMDVHYVGADIVRDLVTDLQQRYGGERVQFRHVNIITDTLPWADTMLCRDCLFHLSVADITRALTNFLASGIPYILTTTHMPRGQEMNADIPTGHFRYIDLFAAPFEFPRDPLARFEDWQAPEAPREMCLWRADQLREPVERMRKALSLN
jgi:SAM-dependent methyltransferase